MAPFPRSKLSGLKVLVVEDERLIAGSLRRLLSREGAEVTIAATVEAARDRIERDAVWDIVLLDIKLPDGDGLSLLDLMHRGASRRTAVIAVSANLHHAKRSLRLQASRAVLLPKPFEVDDLFTAVEEAMILAERAARESSQPPPPHSQSGEYRSHLTYGPIAAHLITHGVTVGDEAVDLQPAQFRILAQLLSNPGRVFSVPELVEVALRGTHGNGSANIRFQIHGLRRKLGAAGRLIETSGGGYGIGLSRTEEFDTPAVDATNLASEGGRSGD